MTRPLTLTAREKDTLRTAYYGLTRHERKRLREEARHGDRLGQRICATLGIVVDAE